LRRKGVTLLGKFLVNLGFLRRNVVIDYFLVQSGQFG
jgi:hypothetical protein